MAIYEFDLRLNGNAMGAMGTYHSAHLGIWSNGRNAGRVASLGCHSLSVRVSDITWPRSAIT